MTAHFEQRSEERNLTDDDLAKALTGKCTPQAGGVEKWRRGRIVVILGPNAEKITCWKMLKKDIKKKLSR